MSFVKLGRYEINLDSVAFIEDKTVSPDEELKKFLDRGKAKGLTLEKTVVIHFLSNYTLALSGDDAKELLTVINSYRRKRA
jgi:hypothetical protein